MRSRTIILATTLCLAMLVPLAVQAQSEISEIAEPFTFDKTRQFDFWIGKGTAVWRYYKDGEYHNYNYTTHHVYPILDGKALVELAAADTANFQGYVTRGFSVRYYDTTKAKWVMVESWPGPNRTGFGWRDGVFHHGRSELFHASVDTAGLETISRYTFSDISPERFRWDMGISKDTGKTWSTPLIADFTFVAPKPGPVVEDGKLFTFGEGGLCTDSNFHVFSFLEGNWDGTYETKQGDEWQTTAATMTAYPMLGGCAMYSTLRIDKAGAEYELFRAHLFSTKHNRWIALRLDNQPGRGHEFQADSTDDGNLELVEWRPETFNGEVDDVLQKTTWTDTDGATISYEVAESTDGGTSWETVARVELTRRM